MLTTYNCEDSDSSSEGSTNLINNLQMPKYEVEYTVGPLLVDSQPPSMIINANSPEEARKKFIKLMPIKVTIWGIRDYREFNGETAFNTIVSPIFNKKK